MKNVCDLHLKVNRSIYLSWTFQLNDGFSSIGTPCLCFCVSLGVVVLADWGPTSMSLSAIITDVTAGVSAWICIAWMPSYSAIAAWCKIFCLACICMHLWNDSVCLSWDLYSWHHVMILASFVLTLMWFHYYYLLSAYLQVCIYYKSSMHFITSTYIHIPEGMFRCGPYILGGLTQLVSWVANYVHARYIQFLICRIHLNLLFLQRTIYINHKKLKLLLLATWVITRKDSGAVHRVNMKLYCQ